MVSEYSPALPMQYLESGTATGVKIPQGGLVSPGVLDVVFMDASGNYVSPYELSYGVCAVDANGVELLKGIPDRSPVSVRTGRFSPNFRVGDKWETGTYRIKWAYRMAASDTELVRPIDFEVVSAGVYDVRLVGMGLFNIKATVLVVE